MSFTANITSMERFHSHLIQAQQCDSVQEHVRKALAHLCTQAEHYENIISKNTPFHGEFFICIQTNNTDTETCFQILECLIIFIREKQLRATNLTPLNADEQALLNYYEQSGLWHYDDGTLLNSWYWYHLPKLCGYTE